MDKRAMGSIRGWTKYNNWLKLAIICPYKGCGQDVYCISKLSLKVDRMERISIYRLVTALFIILFMTTGCTLIHLKKEVKDIQATTVIVGRVEGKFPGNGPIIVAAWSMDDGINIENYTVLHDSGEYELAVGQGNYYVFAYWDKNSNLIYEAGEPAGQYGEPKLVRVPAVGVVSGIHIVIPEEEKHIAIPHGQIISSIKPQKIYSRQAGVITDLDDERFSKAYGAKGFWEPWSFFNQFGGTIYFLEEYDPDKTPVLFIHGATGTPIDWRYFVDHIDRTRFQPWFFYYPTGLRIDSMAYLLLWKLVNLQAKYQFDKMYMTAHSMGGLVARSFLVNYGQQFPYVKLFVSLATPWGGDPIAEYGVKQSPAVIPSWIDMQPEGDFIKSLYRKKMPESVSFYLFYGYRGSRNPFRSNNDSTIALSSLLDDRPQSEAKMSYAFDEGHASILFSEKVVSQYNATLSTFDEKDSTTRQQPGGYLKIQFSYDSDDKVRKPSPTLILRRKGQKEEEIVVYLDAGDNGKILGPFPEGEYVANMITYAAKTEKKFVPVAIESNRTKELGFVFQPDGVIRGCVTAALEPEDKFMGRPKIRYRSIDTTINIQSIALKGDGIQRILQHQKGPELNPLDPFIWRIDGCYNNCFGFFGLPAGDYKLFIKAEGYKPVEKKYSVMPGIPKDFRATELTPD